MTSRRTAVLACLLWAVLLLALTATDWVRASGTSALTGSVPLRVSGGDAAPGVQAAALVLGACGLALGLVGRAGRLLVAAAAAASGAIVVVSAIAVAGDPTGPARTAALAATGVGRLTTPAQVAWPTYAAVLLGTLAFVTGLGVAVLSRRWPAASRRHEAGPRGSGGRSGDAPRATAPPETAAPRTVAPSGTAAPQDPASSHGQEAWDALSRGDDPSESDTLVPSADPSGGHDEDGRPQGP